MVNGKPDGVGTLDFASPEQLLKGMTLVQGGVFSLGKIAWFLYAGHRQGDNEIRSYGFSFGVDSAVRRTVKTAWPIIHHQPAQTNPQPTTNQLAFPHCPDV